MKTIQSVIDYKINTKVLNTIVGGDAGTCYVNGNPTDVWSDTNGDGKLGEGDLICML